VTKVAKGEKPDPGARTCVGFIGADEYLEAIGEPDNLHLHVHFADLQG
jgi:hypothetical protein